MLNSIFLFLTYADKIRQQERKLWLISGQMWLSAAQRPRHETEVAKQSQPLRKWEAVPSSGSWQRLNIFTHHPTNLLPGTSCSSCAPHLALPCLFLHITLMTFWHTIYFIFPSFLLKRKFCKVKALFSLQTHHCLALVEVKRYFLNEFYRSKWKDYFNIIYEPIQNKTILRGTFSYPRLSNNRCMVPFDV